MGLDPDKLRPFLDAIMRRPEDDTPRMALADFLTDHDDPLGEFIAAGLDYAAYACGEIDSKVEAVKRAAHLIRMTEQARRACELFWPGISHETGGLAGFSMLPSWDEPMCLARPPLALAVVFDRGLPAKVYCPMADWMAYGPRAVAAPLVYVRLTDRLPARQRSLGYETVGQTRFQPAGVARPLPAETWVWEDAGYAFHDTHPPHHVRERQRLFHELAEALCWKRALGGGLVPISNGRFLTEKDAYNALSDACLRWSRHEAHMRRDVADVAKKVSNSWRARRGRAGGAVRD